MRRMNNLVTSVTLMLAAGFVVAAPAAADTDPTWTVEVHVVAPSGGPAPGVFVAGISYGFGTTDAHGRVTIEMPGDPQEVCAELDDSSQHLAGPTGWAPACAAIPVSAGHHPRVTLRFTVGAAVTGRLLDHRTGRPIPDLGLRAYGLHQDPFNADDETATGDDGTWLFRNLPASDGVLYTGDRFHSYPDAPHGYSGYTDKPDGVEVDVAAGSTTDLGAQNVSPLVEYRGTVGDSAGTAVPGATVQVGDVDGDPTTPFPPAPNSQQFIAVAVTAADGTYSTTLPWTASPRRQVCAYVGLATTQHPTGQGLACHAVDSAALSVKQNLTVGSAGAVHGSVAGTTSYLATVQVRVRGEDVVVVGSVAHDGTYTVRGVPPGRRVVTIVTNSARATSGPVAVVADATTEVPTITLP